MGCLMSLYNDFDNFKDIETKSLLEITKKYDVNYDTAHVIKINDKNIDIIATIQCNYFDRMVYLGYCEKINEYYVVKTKCGFNESNILRKIQNPLYTATPVNFIKTNRDETMFLKYCKWGDLFDFYECNEFKVPETITKYFFIKMMNSIEYLHMNNILHNDIKPENFFIDDDFKILIGDFGSSFDVDDVKLQYKSNIKIGTNSYVSTETRKNNIVSEKSDIWSLGATIYSICSGYMIYDGISDRISSYDIFNVIKIHDPFTNEYDVSKNMKNIIMNMTNNDCTQRSSIEELREHDLFDKFDCNSLKISFDTESNKICFKIGDIKWYANIM